jgi:hypothetical protein
VVYDEGGRYGEDAAWFRTFWDNVYLRGWAVFEESGTISRDRYGQPATGLPFGRGFVIGRDGRVVLPYFGHQPRLVIDTINRLLREQPGPRPGGRRLRP